MLVALLGVAKQLLSLKATCPTCGKTFTAFGNTYMIGLHRRNGGTGLCTYTGTVNAS